MVDSVVEELARKRLGRTIKGKWRLDRLLGVGGMAAVYAATHRNGARVAIKMLHATISASQQIRARFVREGYLANKVDHPGVVRVLDDDIDDQDQAAFLVMDLVMGSTLSDRAMERLLNDGEVLDVAEQVLQVLTSAHKQGIIHRDLKPDNLLVDNVGKVHVLDFGIARLLDDATGNISATKTGTAFGTPGFMAPEQALGKQHLITAKTDLYALGATLFALVCGDFVHAAENPQELMILVATQPARSLGELAPHMAKDVIGLIDKSTRNEPDKRWLSAEDMLAEVRRVKAKLGITSSPVLPIKPGDLDQTAPPPVVVATPPASPAPPAREISAATAARAAPPRPMLTKAPVMAKVPAAPQFKPQPMNTPPMGQGLMGQPLAVMPSPVNGAPVNGGGAPSLGAKPSTHIPTSRGMAAISQPVPVPESSSAQIESGDLVESEGPPPMVPVRPFGEPETMAQQRNSTPAASFDAHALGAPNTLEADMTTPVAPGRRRMGAVIAVVGSAALLGLIALAVSSSRGRSPSSGSEHGAEATSAPTVAKSATAATTTTGATQTPTVDTTASVASTAPKATATAPGTTKPTSTATTTVGKPSVTTKPTIKKPIDVGY